MEINKSTNSTFSVRKCPYLDTIKREVLDFDCEKQCSVSLSHKNVYICLVCGLYFQGRGDTTHAFYHSVQSDHHVFMNINTLKFYCLPDNYEVLDTSLNDIRLAANPIFSEELIHKIDDNDTLLSDQLGSPFIPGIIGMNILGKGDYINVTIQALSQVKHLRNYFLNEDNYKFCQNSVVQQFGILIRKIWSPYRFRSLISPQEFVNEIIHASNNRFNIQKSMDILPFLTWFINYLHTALKDKKNNSIISDCFRGSLEVEIIQYIEREVKKQKLDQPVGPIFNPETKTVEIPTENNDIKEDRFQKEVSVKTIPYFFVSLDLPPMPLFQDENKKKLVKTVPLLTLLDKYDGEYITHDVASNTDRKYKIKQLPKYILFTIPRFDKDLNYNRKNSTIIELPLRYLDMNNYVIPPDVSSLPKKEDIASSSISELKLLLKKYKVDTTSIVEKEELIDLCKNLIDTIENESKNTKYNLILNAIHCIEVNKELSSKQTLFDIGYYKCYLRHFISKRWYEMQDSNVQSANPNNICLSESSILVYARTDCE